MSNFPNSQPSQENPFTSGMKKLRLEGPPPDFTLLTSSQTFPIHKIVLFCHSDVLYKMASNPAFLECQTGQAELKDVQACYLECLVEWMYDPFSPYTTTKRSEHEDVEFDMQMLILADKFNVQGLARMAKQRLYVRISEAVKDSRKFQGLVEKIYECEDLDEAVLEFAVGEATRRLECLSSEGDGEGLLETRPEFGERVLRKLVEGKGAKAKWVEEKRARRERRSSLVDYDREAVHYMNDLFGLFD